MSDNLDVTDILRITAFFVGLGLLFWGVIDFSALGGMELLDAISVGGTAFLKFIFGVFLMIVSLNPNAVETVLKVFIRV